VAALPEGKAATLAVQRFSEVRSAPVMVLPWQVVLSLRHDLTPNT
jgi:hypothetical protein